MCFLFHILAVLPDMSWPSLRPPMALCWRTWLPSSVRRRRVPPKQHTNCTIEKLRWDTKRLKRYTLLKILNDVENWENWKLISSWYFTIDSWDNWEFLFSFCDTWDDWSLIQLAQFDPLDVMKVDGESLKISLAMQSSPIVAKIICNPSGFYVNAANCCKLSEKKYETSWKYCKWN